MGLKTLAGLVSGCLLMASAAFAQTSFVIYDPLRIAPEKNYTENDEQIVKTKALPKSRDRWSDQSDCDGSNLNVIGAVNGAFTKKAAEQRAIVYEMCQTGNGFANNGIAIVENGSIVAHFVEAGGWNLDVVRIADLNKNGFDELAIQTGGGMHQGYTGSSASVVEISAKAIKTFGPFLVYTNECENGGPEQFCDRSYRITARSAAVPTFSRQKYTNKGSDEKPRWVASGKLLPAKAIPDAETKYTLVK